MPAVSAHGVHGPQTIRRPAKLSPPVCQGKKILDKTPELRSSTLVISLEAADRAMSCTELLSDQAQGLLKSKPNVEVCNAMCKQ